MIVSLGKNAYSEEPTSAIRLSPKEEGFCSAVLAGRNPSDAYRAAYQPKRAKAKTIHEMASRLMAKRKIRTRLAELMQPVIERAQLTRAEWLERFAYLPSRCTKYVRQACNPIAITKLADCEAAAIAAFGYTVVWQTVVTCRRQAAER